MSSSRGNGDAHGPGGDPSWLGGKDRDGTSGTGWSSGFGSESRADSDFGGDVASEAPRPQGPEFGGEAAGRGGEQEPGWAESFTGQDDASGDEGTGKGSGAKVFGALATLVGLGIFAIVAYRMGFDVWWVIFFVAFPMISRLLRSTGRGGRRR
ncbi:hypothetical protein [Brachybacterium sacelli]|uniref:Uncharacterized protein n=1 Tax=Brachybacterium sacelli TaxID=173364 RepID=A0ABS4WZZ2_9MICO|nr:hypothetical protein [Brachybacterium sacelli]MBP2381054.1 hypothetical protein [Brachybacterium sacelli]